MEDRNEERDKAKALRSQLDLCRRLAQESSDPELTERLRSIVETLEEQQMVASVEL